MPPYENLRHPTPPYATLCHPMPPYATLCHFWSPLRAYASGLSLPWCIYLVFLLSQNVVEPVRRHHVAAVAWHTRASFHPTLPDGAHTEKRSTNPFAHTEKRSTKPFAVDRSDDSLRSLILGFAADLDRTAGPDGSAAARNFKLWQAMSLPFETKMVISS